MRRGARPKYKLNRSYIAQEKRRQEKNDAAKTEDIYKEMLRSKPRRRH